MEEQKTYYSPEPFSGFINGRSYRSEIFDSGKTETEWDRLKLEINHAVKGSVKLSVYISDDMEHIPDGNVITSEHTDVLLYKNGIKGRYLRFKVEVKSHNEKANFTAYKLTFPKITFVKYLPAIYYGNEHLERFLAVYQNQYLDAEREIMNYHRQLNATTAETAMLSRLVEFVGEDMFLSLPEKRLRKILSVAALLYRIKGTKNCVKLLIYALTGEIPVIVDCADELSESERKLFGSEKGHFYLMLRSRPKDVKLDLLDRFVKQFIPINAFYTTIFLDENKTVGNLCFLGINSVISDKKQAIVGVSRLGEDLRL